MGVFDYYIRGIARDIRISNNYIVSDLNIY